MTRFIASLFLVASLAPMARAHFVWILPGEAGKVQVVFSDSLAPDDAVPIKAIQSTELFVRGANGQKVPIKLTEAKAALAATVPAKEPGIVAGSTKYGIVKRGDAAPFELHYHSKAIVGWPPTAECCQPWHALPLEIVPILEGQGAKLHVAGVRAYWQGKPLPNAEVVVVGDKQPETGVTDSDGFFRSAKETLPQTGLVGVRVAFKIPAKDAKNLETRHHATLVWAAPAPGKQSSPPVKADAQATKLLAEARAARANWDKFPGFTADLELNHAGKIEKGRVTVSAEGKVTVELADKEQLPWVKRQLASLVGHRLDDGTERETPCAFPDGVRDHPLGRAIRVLNDELHSSYRIRDKQILEVNRAMGDERFTITVLENQQNAEKKFLPVSYVVNSWNNKSGALIRSQTFHHTWQRVGGFDLPALVSVVDAGPATAGSLEVRSLKLWNYKLAKAGK